MKGLGAGIREAKQKKFEQEASEAAIFTAASIAEEKQKAGMPLTAQELQSIKMAGSDKLSKKKAQIMEKAMTDPMSGAYVGTQRAHQAISQAAIDAEERKEKLAKMMADIAYRQQQEKVNQQNADTRGQRADEQRSAAQNKLVEEGKIKGHNITFDEKGNASSTPFTPEQIAADPVLKLQQAKEKAYTDAAVARVRQGDLRIAHQNEELNYKKSLLDSKANSANAKAPNGAKFTYEEQRRIDLSNVGQQYVTKMQAIVKKRPDLFGAGAWGQNKFKTALADKDPDAMQFVTWAEFAAPAIANMHGRNATLVKDLRDFNSSFYQNPEVTAVKLATESEALGAMSRTGGRPASQLPRGSAGVGASAAPYNKPAGGSSSAADDAAQFGGTVRKQ
jgi:hypothetical protein